MRVIVTKQFTSGLLEGLTVEQEVPAGIFNVGDVIERGPFTPSGYTVTAVKEFCGLCSGPVTEEDVKESHQIEVDGVFHVLCADCDDKLMTEVQS